MEVDRGVVVGSGSVVGDGTMLDQESTVEANVTLGRDVQVSQGVEIQGNAASAKARSSIKAWFFARVQWLVNMPELDAIQKWATTA